MQTDVDTTAPPAPVVSFVLDQTASDVARSRTLDSLTGQADAAWELLHAGPGTGDPRVRQVAANPLDQARGAFVVRLMGGDTVAPGAVGVLRAVLVQEPDVCCVYGSGGVRTTDGATTTQRRPVWSPERLRHGFYFESGAFVRREALEEVRGHDGAVTTGPGWDYDLTLRVTERGGRVVAVDDLLVTRDEPVGAHDAEARARVRSAQTQLHRLDIRGSVSRGRMPGQLVVQRTPDHTAAVSLVVVATGHRARAWGTNRTMLLHALTSMRGDARRDLDVVVVHASTMPPSVLAEAQALKGIRVRSVVVDDDATVGVRRNIGALHADGDLIVFVGEDTESGTADILGALAAPLREGDVGTVGPKIIRPSLVIDQAGLGWDGSGVRALHRDSVHLVDDGPLSALWIDREVTALSGGCLAMRREVMELVGGFNETMPGRAIDVDLGLKMRHHGFRNLWLSDAVVFDLGEPEPTAETTELALRPRWAHLPPHVDPFEAVGG